MDGPALDASELRIIIGIVGAIIFALIYFFGRPRKPGQGRRKLFQNDSSDRVEPTMGDVDAAGTLPAQGQLEVGLQNELDKLGSAIAEQRNESAPGRKGPMPGVRPAAQPVDRIVTLYVAARASETIHGASLIVAAEKAGLVFGDKGIFHRLVSGRAEAGPVFSMANMLKPGNFDMREIDELRTPGVCFFMALPGPIPALDGWDALLPTAQRMAELLDATVLDEERNALGRQRIAHIRDELRAYDRKYESNQIKLR
ncbi:MAG TPA: cell division protein ZipA [Rudaea sp.]|jgi:cell division protein ZipA|uniref:cell division protein ZipA n=1 Tax=Rudaea sp. TaxID=2136325 RepID=UPI002F936707